MTQKERREKLMSDEDRIAAWKSKDRRCIYCRGQRPVETITDRLFGCCEPCAKWDNAQVALQSLPCVCCGKKLTPDDEEFTVNTVDHLGFFDGMATRVSCGYGSRLDGNVYMIAICDECTRKKVAEGKLIYVYNP